MYHVSAQGVDERMINVHYYYYYCSKYYTVKRIKKGGKWLAYSAFLIVVSCGVLLTK